MSITNHDVFVASPSVIDSAAYAHAPKKSKHLASTGEQVFRDYDLAPERVTGLYYEHHKRQTYAFAKARREHFSELRQGKVRPQSERCWSIWIP